MLNQAVYLYQESRFSFCCSFETWKLLHQLIVSHFREEIIVYLLHFASLHCSSRVWKRHLFSFAPSFLCLLTRKTDCIVWELWSVNTLQFLYLRPTFKWHNSKAQGCEMVALYESLPFICLGSFPPHLVLSICIIQSELVYVLLEWICILLFYMQVFYEDVVNEMHERARHKDCLCPDGTQEHKTT